MYDCNGGNTDQMQSSNPSCGFLLLIQKQMFYFVFVKLSGAVNSVKTWINSMIHIDVLRFLFLRRVGNQMPKNSVACISSPHIVCF
mmetsp:Transcript_40785/g.59902  ORF Transcript_40785/g.59902 Transcript_40785/m.59902 type:complete len:86 (+) Transcript_40785:362-619(+)